MKEFVFLYPIPEYFDSRIEVDSYGKEGGIEAFRARYKDLLNQCIDLRYRKKGFGINYVIFDRHAISDVIELQPADRILNAGIDFSTLKKYIYPNPDDILNQLGALRILRVAGFHLTDCVEKLAKRAYEKGLDVLVDEDLTQLFGGRMDDDDFKIDEYLSIGPKRSWGASYYFYIERRKNRPWLWQDYEIS